MAQKQFPSHPTLVYQLVGSDIYAKPGSKVRIYTNTLATNPAFISLTNGGAAVANSELTVDANSLLPTFYGPTDDTTVLYAKGVGAATIIEIYAHFNQRLAQDRTEIEDLQEYNQLVTSGTRPATGLVIGQGIYETDTKKSLVWNGTAWVGRELDTPWTTLTHPAGWTGSDALRYQRTNGNLVTVSGTVLNVNTYTPDITHIIATLPAGFRPATSVIFPIQTTVPSTLQGEIFPDGTIVSMRGAAVATTNVFHGINVSFRVA